VPFPIKLPETGDLYVVAYNAEGYKDKEKKIVLDLRDGADIKIVAKGAMNENCVGKVSGKKHGQYVVVIQETKGRYQYRFGVWMIDAALRGVLPQLPFVNINQEEFQKDEKECTASISCLTTKPQTIQTTTTSNQNAPALTQNTKVTPPKFYIVQSHFLDNSENDEKLHKWSVSLSAESKGYVESVIWQLHKSFPQPNEICTEFPFRISRVGWGTFKVNADIKTFNNEIIKCGHNLEFSKEGVEVCKSEVLFN